MSYYRFLAPQIFHGFQDDKKGTDQQTVCPLFGINIYTASLAPSIDKTAVIWTLARSVEQATN